MKLSSLYAAASLAAISLTSVAFAHNHITVDTVSGSAGDKILIKAGYNPSESAFAIGDGHLKRDGLIAFYGVEDEFTSGPIAGWFGGDEVLLTSNFYFSTGRLAGGDFRWEIAAITPIGEGNTQAAWGTFGEGGEFEVAAKSDGVSRELRSFATPAGSHNHDQGYGFLNSGLLDVTFVVWDASGKFADSDPLKIRFRVGKQCPADLNADDVVEDADFVVFVSAYNTLDCADPSMAFECPADLNLDGFVDDADFIQFVQAYNALLCL
ncbi:MAG: hypothetical protein ACREJD_15970 [Phycisphaerales bacterium]